MPAVPRIVVLGAGVSGLAAAHRLAELSRSEGRALDLTVLEASSRAGGLIRTRREDGFLWEEGPDSFLTEKPWALDLCRRAGLESELLPTRPEFQRSFVARRGRLYPVPEGFYLLAPSRLTPFALSPIFSWAGKLRMLMDLFIPSGAAGSDESLAAFVRRRLGREALERMAQPMAAGIYTADPETLSLRATFPRFLEMEARHGGVIRALMAARREKKGLPHAGTSGPRYGLFVTLKQGLSSLVESLTARLPAGALRLGASASGLRREGGLWHIRVGDQEIAAEGLCVATPAPRAASLLREVDAPLAAALDEIPQASSATLHLAYDRAQVRHPLDGFGFVVPAAERRSLIGCSFTSVKFAGRAPEGRVILRAFVGPGHALEMDDAGLTASVRRDVEELLGIRGEPRIQSLRRHPDSMPQYTLGHLDRVARLEGRVRELPGLALAGNATRGVGLPDCVRSGEAAAEALWSSVYPARS